MRKVRRGRMVSSAYPVLTVERGRRGLRAQMGKITITPWVLQDPLDPGVRSQKPTPVMSTVPTTNTAPAIVNAKATG